MQETWVQSLGWEDPLEKGTARKNLRSACWVVLRNEDLGLVGMPGFKASDQIRSDQSLSHVRLFVTPWSVHRILQARILEWVTFPSLGDLPDPGIEPRSPTLLTDALPSDPAGKGLIA